MDFHRALFSSACILYIPVFVLHDVSQLQLVDPLKAVRYLVIGSLNCAQSVVITSQVDTTCFSVSLEGVPCSHCAADLTLNSSD